MKKIALEVPEDVYEAITDEGLREFRNVSQQASYLLLTWSREVQMKRQKTEKVVSSALPSRAAESLNGPAA